MGQQVTGSIKLSVQGTGSDRSKVYVTRTGDITDVSTVVHAAKQITVSAGAYTVVYMPEAGNPVSCNVLHIRASAPLYIAIKYKDNPSSYATTVASHLLVKGGRVNALEIKALSGTRTVEILLAGRP
jgi:hypothetical protein